MPNLHELQFTVLVKAFYKDGLDLECLPSLRYVRALFDCNDAFPDDVDKAEAELRRLAELHPNTPKLSTFQL
jgi:hypothetical protein